jgi:demethylmenaquinone methyltransferase / 2-methoxy-6-polyprenyl-1,4-benzoquinol methylase
MKLHDGYSYAQYFFSAKNAATYDSLVYYATFGQDKVWKNQIAKIVKRHTFNPTIILDLAAGTGILSLKLKEGSESVLVHSLDLTLDYLKKAKEKSPRLFLINSTAELLPFQAETFDYVVSSYLLKYINTEMVAAESWRVLKHHGLVIFHDFTCPTDIMTRKFWKFYISLLKLSGRLVKEWEPTFQRLEEVICKNRSWPRDASKCLQDVGFDEISCRYFTLGTSAIVSARKP